MAASSLGNNSVLLTYWRCFIGRDFVEGAERGFLCVPLTSFSPCTRYNSPVIYFSKWKQAIENVGNIHIIHLPAYLQITYFPRVSFPFEHNEYGDAPTAIGISTCLYISTGTMSRYDSGRESAVEFDHSAVECIALYFKRRRRKVAKQLAGLKRRVKIHRVELVPLSSIARYYSNSFWLRICIPCDG